MKMQMVDCIILANKLNNGFIKNNYIVQTISDRLFLKSNRSFFNHCTY